MRVLSNPMGIAPNAATKKYLETVEKEKAKPIQAPKDSEESRTKEQFAQLRQMTSMVKMPNGARVPYSLAKPYLDAYERLNAADKAEIAQTPKRPVLLPR